LRDLLLFRPAEPQPLPLRRRGRPDLPPAAGSARASLDPRFLPGGPARGLLPRPLPAGHGFAARGPYPARLPALGAGAGEPPARRPPRRRRGRGHRTGGGALRSPRHQRLRGPRERRPSDRRRPGARPAGHDQYNVPDLFPDVAPGRPVRLTVDLKTGTLVDRQEIAYDRAPDFPAIDPELAGRPYEDFWMLGISRTGCPGRKTFDQLVHASWAHPGRVDVWQAPPGHYLGGEPAFAANPQGGGAVLCQRFDGASGDSAFLVFDAFDVAAGPVAVLPLDRPLHLGFHALFVDRFVRSPQTVSDPLR